jgi:hypothetical protein
VKNWFQNLPFKFNLQRYNEASQKYKEGKFIVEKAMVLHEGGW